MSKRPTINGLVAALATIPLAGILGVVCPWMRGAQTMPMADSLAWAENVTRPAYQTAQLGMIVAFVLPLAGFWALYEALARRGPVRTALWGMWLSIAGTALALPALGVMAFLMPVAGHRDKMGDLAMSELVNEVIFGPLLVISLCSAAAYVLGPVLFSVAIWRAGLSKIAAGLFALHGLLLVLGFGLYPALIAGWVLLGVSGLILMLGVRQASSKSG